MKSADWLTPPEWINALGPFDLDPCVMEYMPWKTAQRGYCLRERDGLTAKWYGRIWLNPPFGQQAAAWLRKLRDHGDGIALIPARTETKMFYESVWGKASGICFVKGRPHFHYPDGTRAPFNSGAPIALVSYDNEPTEFNRLRLQQSKLGFVAPASEPWF